MKANHPIEIGLSNNIFDNPADILTCIENIATEFVAIEIELSEGAQKTILESDLVQYNTLIEGLTNIQKKKNLTYSVHAAWFGPGTDLLCPDEQERRKSIKILLQAIKFSKEIGSKIVTFHPGNSSGRKGTELVDSMVKSIEEVLQETITQDIELCLEVMGAHRPKYAIFYPEELIEICQKTGISICIDIPHLASLIPETEPMLEAVEMLCPCSKQVHIADTNLPQHRHIPIGLGNVPILDIILTLEKNGYKNDAIVEEYNKGYTAQQYWDKAIEFRAAYLQS